MSRVKGKSIVRKKRVRLNFLANLFLMPGGQHQQKHGGHPAKRNTNCKPSVIPFKMF